MDERLTDLPASELLRRLASAEPIPGGGSAAALAGAMGASLMQMVVALTAGRAGSEAHETELTEIANAAATWQAELLRLTELDATAYDAVVRARRLPRGTDLERSARDVQVAAATREATRIPLETVRRAAEVLVLAERLAPIGNRNAISDVGVGALLATTAMRGAALNVRINLPYLPVDEPLRDEAATDLDRLLDGVDAREAAIRRSVEDRLG